MDWVMLIVFVISWLFAAAALLSAVAVLRNSFHEAEYFTYAPPFAVGLVLLLLFVWTGILRPELPVTGLPLLPLGVGALVCFGFAATVALFNSPTALVPKKSRDQPSLFADWLERRRRHRGKAATRARVIVPYRLVVRLKMTARRTWRTVPAYRFKDLTFEAPDLDALEAELVHRCQDYFQNPSPPRRAPQLVFVWSDKGWHEMASVDHGTTPHIHTALRVVEIKIERTLDGGLVAMSSEPALTVEASSLERLVPLMRSSLIQAHKPRGKDGLDHLRFIYVREIG